MSESLCENCKKVLNNKRVNNDLKNICIFEKGKIKNFIWFDRRKQTPEFLNNLIEQKIKNYEFIIIESVLTKGGYKDVIAVINNQKEVKNIINKSNEDNNVKSLIHNNYNINRWVIRRASYFD